MPQDQLDPAIAQIVEAMARADVARDLATKPESSSAEDKGYPLPETVDPAMAVATLLASEQFAADLAKPDQETK